MLPVALAFRTHDLRIDGIDDGGRYEGDCTGYLLRDTVCGIGYRAAEDIDQYGDTLIADDDTARRIYRPTRKTA